MVHARRGRVGGLTLTDPCPLLAACRLRKALADAEEAFYRELDGYTITDLVARPLPLVFLGAPLNDPTDERTIR